MDLKRPAEELADHAEEMIHSMLDRVASRLRFGLRLRSTSADTDARGAEFMTAEPPGRVEVTVVEQQKPVREKHERSNRLI